MKVSLPATVHALKEALGWCPISPNLKGERETIVKNVVQATRYPLAAGILTILSVVLCVMIGLWSLGASLGILDASPDRSYTVLTPLDNGTIVVVEGLSPGFTDTFGLLTGVYSLIAAGFGLTCGYLTLKREHYSLAIMSACSVWVSAALSLFVRHGWIVGTPTLVIATLVLAFVTFSRKEFR